MTTVPVPLLYLTRQPATNLGGMVAAVQRFLLIHQPSDGGSGSDREALRADRNLFCSPSRLVKSSPSALCDRGEGFALFVG